MGPDSLPPMDVQRKSVSLWLVVAGVFITGLGAGVLIPAGLKFFGLNDSRVVTTQDNPMTMTMPNGKLRRVDPPLSNQPATAAVAEVKPVIKAKQKLAAVALRSNKKDKKADKVIAKVEKEKPAPVKEAAPAPKAKSEEVQAMAANAAKTPTQDLIEEVPSALTAVQVEKLMQTNPNVLAKNQKALARPVSLPPSQALNANSQSLAALPILKSDPRAENKTYPVSINNASFSKANLSNCGKRCALLGMDAMGNPIKAIIDGTAYASALLQHNGTINISGQPRIVKNQQVLVVENITFNLAPTQKAVAKRGRSASAAMPVAAEAKASGYTEVSFEGDDLKPGTVIKNRKQIPIEDQQEIPAP
ncbi:MAG: hypothetical protein M3Q07_06645 [Pseudobdellovibrionaceae bacterium]|nr:hypothetical protein [Pseudobdellovibrionaceae bacterium]